MNLIYTCKIYGIVFRMRPSLTKLDFCFCINVDQ